MNVHGFVEFRQLDEWWAAICVGTLLVPSSQLSALLLAAAGAAGTSAPPASMSIDFKSMFDPIRDDVRGVVQLSLNELIALQSDGTAEFTSRDVESIFSETQFDVLLEMSAVLGRRFGNANVRLLVYVD